MAAGARHDGQDGPLVAHEAEHNLRPVLGALRVEVEVGAWVGGATSAAVCRP